MSATIDKLIINSPYETPAEHWSYDRETRSFSRVPGRRPAGYVVATPNSRSFDDPGIFVSIELVNRIRPRVDQWRAAGYPGVTGITKRLLQHWQDPEERKDRRFFFCQLEAIETIIWLTEAPEADKVGINIPGDGGDFSRWCSKMATGSGKTIIMSMVIAWQVLNKVTNKQDGRFSKNVLVVAPGLTVKSRLQVLNPDSEDNYYKEFNIVPNNLLEMLRQGKVRIINWHALAWDTEADVKKRRSVDKRGVKSDEAYTREVLSDMANASNIIVINDEAHHAWRVNPELKVKREDKDKVQEATVWIGGLDRIHKTRRIIRCFDLSATPFAPSGKRADEEALFPWIISDFGLNDAIESGLVKTPRVVVRDDGSVDQDLRSRLYHIYADDSVRDDINRRALPTEPLPQLLINGYYLLGKDWLETKLSWEGQGHRVPPVMITVANRTETAARIRYAFEMNHVLIPELCDPRRLLQIDSSILKKAEEETDLAEPVDTQEEEEEGGEEVIEKKMSKKEQAEWLRRLVDTVGKEGAPGEQLQNVISVGMLSEGWDAKTVTHIMGLRAFSSQLLCEQVVGRGLRRVSYDVGDDGLLQPEYVNIFGVPFTFLPHEGGEDGPPPPPPPPKTKVEPVAEKAAYAMEFPNIIRFDTVYHPKLVVKLENVAPLILDPKDSITEAFMGQIIGGKPNVASLSEIDLKDISERFRLQTIIFQVAATIYNQETRSDWKGSKDQFLIQLIQIVERFIASDKIQITDAQYQSDPVRRKIIILLNMHKLVYHIWYTIKSENTERRSPVFDPVYPFFSTENIRTWYTSKPCERFAKTHLNFVVVDSTWEYTAARTINDHPAVQSFVKNDHLGFVIYYSYQGTAGRKFFPDYLIRLGNGKTLVLEIKGQDSEINRVKRQFLEEWVQAVNDYGKCGQWCWDVAFEESEVYGILDKHGK